MKILLFVLVAGLAHAETAEVKKFNDALIKSVEKDLKTDNDAGFKKQGASRAPASVDEGAGDLPKEEQKIEKNFKQLGTNKW